ncbi:carboxyltransferase domain-containing protein [Blastomonas sp. AAP53]|uniref:5-oxoprolinase subunit B family protein n=1 Tax=Blastomonas sp. AAP53 TaxID=1248760 RepID=UPI0002DA26CD|nr:carboxyltransferase domain-containing protein [Blastomonas sp. AAP53]
MSQPIFCADDWLMIQALPPDRVAALAMAAEAQGWDDIVPGLDSLSLSWNPQQRTLDAAKTTALALLEGNSEDTASASPSAATLHICYEQPWAHDADIVAELLGLTTDALPAWHMAQDWRVAMLGFQPGFAYLVCDATTPDIPRLSDPRAHVEAGSVGLLGQHCGLYPHAGPGGWPIIGRIAETLFDAHAPSPALLKAGQPVRFERIDSSELTRRTGGAA